MKKYKTQELWAEEQLNRFGKVSRNEALKHYITRLGAIICKLNKREIKIKGKYEPTEYGMDFVYRVIKKGEDRQLFEAYESNIKKPNSFYENQNKKSGIR